MSSDIDTRRAQVTSAKKKLRQFRASRSGTRVSNPPPLNTSTTENTMMPRRVPSKPELEKVDVQLDVKLDAAPTRPQRHNRKPSRSHHRRDSSMASLSFPQELPRLEPSTDEVVSAREIITTPATPVAQSIAEEQAIARLSSFSFGSKSQAPASCRPPLLPSMPLRRPPLDSSMRDSISRPPFPLDTELSRSSPDSSSRPSSPVGRKKRHSHNRSESISLPNLKLGRPTSLGLPSPGFTSAPSSPFGEATSRSSRLSTPPLTNGSRLKFEPSDKEKEESRRRALDKLTGGPRVEEQRHSITLPSFDDDDDDLSISSSRPPSSSTTLTSTASSSRPSSFAGTSSGSFHGSLTSPLPWSTFEDSDRWSLPHRFDPNKEDAFEPVVPSKTSSVLLSSGLGVLAEEDETESDDAEPEMPPSEVTSPTDEDPTPSRLRELHLVSSTRRGSNPEVRESFARSPARETSFTPTRSRPRPLGLDEATVFIANSTPSPVSRVGRSNSLNSGKARRPPSSRGSSISYKKDDSSSSRDLSIAGIGSPPPVLHDVTSPTERQRCPRPRSMILGMSSRVLGEVEEEEDGLGFRDDSTRPSFESSRDSLDSYSRRDSRDHSELRDRIDAEMERDALREDVDLWRKRCRGLEDKLEAERRETSRLRERVRKLGDRILQQSAAHAAAPSANEEREIAQSRLISEMRDQLFSMASALERERKEKAEALARAAELQTIVDGAKTPQVAAGSLPTTPKSRPKMTFEEYQAQYIDNFADAEDVADEQHDPNLNRMRGWGFPQGPVDTDNKASKRDSFFGLSRARPVRAPKASGSGLGLAWPPNAHDDEGLHDLPPIVVDDTTRSLITPVSPSKAYNATITGRVVSEPVRSFQTPDTSPERPTASASGFGLSFLSGYLSLPRSNSTPQMTPPQPIPRISITPSSVSPKKSLLHLERDAFNARVTSVARGCEIDFRHCCKRCTGDIIEL